MKINWGMTRWGKNRIGERIEVLEQVAKLLRATPGLSGTVWRAVTQARPWGRYTSTPSKSKHAEAKAEGCNFKARLSYIGRPVSKEKWVAG